jgi:HK97 family phage major capsid protein
MTMAENTAPIDLMQELENLKTSLGNDLKKEIPKEAEKSFKALKNRIEETTEELESLKEWKVEKDEADKKNQRCIDKLAKQKDIEVSQKESFDGVFQKALEEHTDEFAKLQRKEVNRVRFDLTEKAIMTISSATTGLVTNVSQNNRGIIELPNRFNHVRDFVQQGTMTGSSFPYMYESAAMVGAPATVAEGALKPEVEVRLTEALAPAEYIAGWTNMSTKLLDDVAGMNTFLRNRLQNALLEAEDTQLISGTGVSPQLKGIGTAGNFTAATDLAAVDDMLQILGGIGQLAGYNRRANAILLSVADYFRLIGTQTETNGLKVVDVTGTGQFTFMGIPVAFTPAIATGTYYVADLQNGALLLFREAPSIIFAYEDSDNIRRNAVTVRIEERVAFPVFGSNYVIKGTF